ncbi:hypothetical protein, partial [Alicyclobacillus contaminans]|uniref:hypothetical protein n=1 Tax=Alicyclobacillus contaminans TaxID=392016 RepID=UPI001B7FE0AD
FGHIFAGAISTGETLAFYGNKRRSRLPEGALENNLIGNGYDGESTRFGQHREPVEGVNRSDRLVEVHSGAAK